MLEVFNTEGPSCRGLNLTKLDYPHLSAPVHFYLLADCKCVSSIATNMAFYLGSALADHRAIVVMVLGAGGGASHLILLSLCL